MATPAELAEQGKCFQCYGATLAQVLKLSLLDTISTSGGGGDSGAQQIVYYVADPNAEAVVPGDLTQPGFATTEDGSGAIFTWNVSLQLWN